MAVAQYRPSFEYNDQQFSKAESITHCYLQEYKVKHFIKTNELNNNYMENACYESESVSSKLSHRPLKGTTDISLSKSEYNNNQS